MSQPSMQASPISRTGLFANGLRLYLPLILLCLYSILSLPAGISVFCTLPGTPSQKPHCPCSLPKYSAVFFKYASRYSPILPPLICGSRSAQMAILLMFTGAGKIHATFFYSSPDPQTLYRNMTFIMSKYDFYHVSSEKLVISLLRIQEVRATLGSAPERLSVTGNRSLNDSTVSLVGWWSAARFFLLNDFWSLSFKPPRVARSFNY